MSGTGEYKAIGGEDTWAGKYENVNPFTKGSMAATKDAMRRYEDMSMYDSALRGIGSNFQGRTDDALRSLNSLTREIPDRYVENVDKFQKAFGKYGPSEAETAFMNKQYKEKWANMSSQLANQGTIRSGHALGAAFDAFGDTMGGMAANVAMQNRQAAYQGASQWMGQAFGAGQYGAGLQAQRDIAQMNTGVQGQLSLADMRNQRWLSAYNTMSQYGAPDVRSPEMYYEPSTGEHLWQGLKDTAGIVSSFIPGGVQVSLPVPGSQIQDTSYLGGRSLGSEAVNPRSFDAFQATSRGINPYSDMKMF
jgi:hypothetical protein